jgi:hypothetical protein
MEELTDQLKQRYPLLTSLRIAGQPQSAQEPLPDFLGLLLAAAESPDHRSCCFVFPDASRVACTTATLLALSKLTREFDDLAREYAQNNFEPGQRVIIWPTGHVYEYEGVLEPEGHWSKRFQLLGKDGLRTLPISDILRVEPTTRKSPRGGLTTPLRGHLESNALDALIEVRSWGNKSMLRNRVMCLTSKRKFETFLNSTALHGPHADVPTSSSLSESQERKLAPYGAHISVKEFSGSSLVDILPWGSVNEDGSLVSSDQYQVEGEPVLAVTNSVENIAETSTLVEPFSRVVFADGPERLTRNLQACDEIADSQKLIVVADHGSEDAVSILEDRDFCVWRVAPEEMYPDRNISKEERSFFFRRTFDAASNYQDLKLDGVACRDEELEAAARDLSQVSRDLNHPDSDEEMKRYLQGLFHLLFRFSDRCVPLEAEEKTEILDRIGALERYVERRAIFVPEEMTTRLRSACEALRELISENTTHSWIGKGKGEALLKTLGANSSLTNQRRIIVTRYPQSVEETRLWLQERGVYDPVVWYRHFPETETFDTVVVLSWLNSERFGKLVQRYAAPEVRLLSYPFEQRWLQQFKSRFSRERASGQPDRVEKSKLLGLPEDLLPPTQSLAPEQPRPDFETQASDSFSIFDIEQKIMKRKKGVPPAARSTQDTCPARYVGFVGEAYAYVTENHEIPVVTSLVTNSSSAPSAIPTRTVDGLGNGDFLLFREGSDREVVRLFAEEMMGSGLYEEQRTLAASWRRALLSLEGDTGQVHRLLRSYGLRKRKSTIRNWLFNRNVIGPWKREDLDVMAAAAKENFTEGPGKVWEAVENIRNAHRRAGHKISEWLLAELADKRDLLTNGQAEVDLDFGRFWVVEVEEIGDNLEQYPAGQVDSLLWEYDY